MFGLASNVHRSERPTSHSCDVMLTEHSAAAPMYAFMVTITLLYRLIIGWFRRLLLTKRAIQDAAQRSDAFELRRVPTIPTATEWGKFLTCFGLRKFVFAVGKLCYMRSSWMFSAVFHDTWRALQTVFCGISSIVCVEDGSTSSTRRRHLISNTNHADASLYIPSVNSQLNGNLLQDLASSGYMDCRLPFLHLRIIATDFLAYETSCSSL